MDDVRNKFDEFVSKIDRRQLLERETLAFEATELIAQLMESQNVTKSELAAQMKRSKAYISQLLSGSRNMTLHTFAGLAFALGHTVELRSAPIAAWSTPTQHAGAPGDRWNMFQDAHFDAVSKFGFEQAA